ncbi:hypothetical protein BRY73_19250 [Ochrobactrum sp. P6BS-III]|uniref:hypothetical protein n=1 Tax=unclassified Ochrobactrum TaxID=239106 RepID=UPI000992987E|nr:hypothetical protein [Ochrobactrum sp. P6BSIII]OOL15425.1 hypothetical protein BRY73_19250 [Ochrobactrum sp. P6BS-III]
MRVSVLSLAAALAVFAFNAEATPISNLQATVQSGLVQKADYRCGRGWRMTYDGVCVPGYRRPPPPPGWGWGPPPPPRWGWGPPPRDWRRHHWRDEYRDRPARHRPRPYWD